MVFTSTTPWKPRNVENFQKVRNWRNWILSVPRVSVCREKKSPWLRQYQSYVSNWYVNGKGFPSTTTWESKNLIFFSKKFKIEFDLYFDLCWRAEIIQVGLKMHLYVDIGDASSSLEGRDLVNWYVNGMVFTSTTPWKPRNVKIFQKVRNWRNWILSVPRPYAEKKIALASSISVLRK